MKRKGTINDHSSSQWLHTVLRSFKIWPGVIALFLVVVPLLLTPSTLVAAPASHEEPIQAEHALLVSSQPAADSILQAPPTSVQMWFSETLIPATSTALVVDTTNRQVDLKDSHVNGNNGAEMDLSLPLLPAGTYVVVWQTQSAIDGHVARGSFLFRIARPDGSIPPIPAVLPTGHIPGAGGIGTPSTNTLDGPTLLQTVSTWIALLLLTFWMGSIIWEIWMFSPDEGRRLSFLAQATRQRRIYTCIALVGILIVDCGMIFGQAAELAGNWSGSISLPLLNAILFESHFGLFWWAREGVALVALLFLLMTQRYSVSKTQREKEAVESGETDHVVEALSGNGQDVLVPVPSQARHLQHGVSAIVPVLKDIPRLPGYLVKGVRQQSWYGQIEALLGLALVIAFVLSGHAAAVSSEPVWLTTSIDLLHLLANAAWVGGLLYIGLILLPTLNTFYKDHSGRDWAIVLAYGLPRFSVIAITSVVLLAGTGSFNTAVHLTSLDQLWSTMYGQILLVKIGIFLVMVGISAYHAFFLRPRLAEELVSGSIPQDLVAQMGRERTIRFLSTQQEKLVIQSGPLSSRGHLLGKRLERWLRLEGTLGAGVLLCVALLGAFAGSLTTPTSPTTLTAQPTGPVTLTNVVSGYSITLHIDPATFGTNTFQVTVKNPKGQGTTGAAVLMDTTMLDMDMGTDELQLSPDTKHPGIYSTQGDLTMAGHWQIEVRVLPATSNNFITTIFLFSAS